MATRIAGGKALPKCLTAGRRRPTRSRRRWCFSRPICRRTPAAPSSRSTAASPTVVACLKRLAASAAGENGAGGPVRPEIIDAVDRQQVGEPGAGAVDAALDGADGAAANSRGVLVGKARGADQDQSLALVRWQLGERGTEFLEFDPAGLLWMRFQRLGIAAVGVFDLAAALAVFRAEQVA